ncbi:hypothetical protein WSM22_30280 [Cytophagales bacterium WSM2-2]|nr:hypothetical protein WSM22_30280 [Cytophagales bacterium WSM2-2]
MRKLYNDFNRYLGGFREFAPLFIRLSVGYHLMQGVWGAVTKPEVMKEVIVFFESQNIFAAPILAPLVAYLEFICGLLFILGAFTRQAALIMVIVFVNAIFIVHLGDTYKSTFPAIVMLSGSLFLLLAGPGRVSVDQLLKRE